MKKKTKNKFMIIDGNNALYRAYYKFANLRAQSGALSGIIYGFPLILNAAIKQHLPDDVIVVFDGGRDKERTKVHPEYKKRDKKVSFDAEDFFKQRDVLVNMLVCLGIKIVWLPEREADDVIWALTKKLKKQNQVIIVSSDKDFNQLISENVSIWNPKADTRYTHKNLEKEVGYRPDQCVDYLILDGDSSDNIPGMVGVGKVTIGKFFEMGMTIEKYLTSDCKEHIKFPKHLLETVFLRNRILIDLRLFNRRYFDNKELFIRMPKKAKIDKTEFNIICSHYDISSFDKSFLRTFKLLFERNKNNKLCLKYLSQVRVELVKPH
jgi:DNA polymerase-1